MIGKRVTIAGAGPAGMVAAIRLAQCDYSVDLYDIREEPGARFSGGFQMVDDYSLDEPVQTFFQRLSLPKQLLEKPLSHAVLFSPSGVPHRVWSDRPYGYFVRRGPGENTLDSLLFRKTQELGITFHPGRRAPDPDIIATGARQVDGLASELHFRTDREERTWVYFNVKDAPGGYAYLFTLEGQGTFGVAVTRNFQEIERHFERCSKFFRSIESFPIIKPVKRRATMNFFLRKSAVHAGRYLAGEAGGFQDYLFGLGLRQAMLTGVLAADSLHDGTNYDAAWRPLLLARNRISVVNRFLYEIAGGRGIDHFLRAAERSDFRTFLQAWIGGPPLHALLFPFIALLWKNRGACTHPPVSHWCRRN